MKLFCFIQIAVAIAAGSAAADAQGAEAIAQWDFDSLNIAPNTQGQDIGPYAATSGIAAANSNASGHHTSTATIWTSPVGNGSIQSFAANPWAVGDYWQISTSTTGYTGITLAWDQTGFGSGSPRDFKLQYSEDNGDFIHGRWRHHSDYQRRVEYHDNKDDLESHGRSRQHCRHR